MPDILTHIAYADEVLEHLEDRQLRGQIKKRMELFRFGAQGPDFFFYHDFLSRKKDDVNAVGNLMHETYTGEFLKQFFDSFLLKETKEAFFYDLLSYYLGFVCHYTLDKTVHPFIYCYSGYNFSEGKEKGRHSALHKKMENHIDVYVWQIKKHKRACTERVHRLIKIEKRTQYPIMDYLHKMITHIYKTNLSVTEIEDSYRHMIKALKLLYDPIGIKKALLYILESVKGKSIDIGKPLYSAEIEESKKYLNLDKRVWAHPLDASIQYNTSFIELYTCAVREGTDMIAQIAELIHKKTPIGMEILGNKSYLTNFIWHSKENLIFVESEGLLSQN